MVLNAAVQMLREADELKEKILKFKIGTSMLQERSLWATQQQLQKVYQKVLILDLDYALDKKVEQDLWNIGFKQQIEALQAISKDRKNPLRSEGQAMLSWLLQAATGFYLCLLHQICTTFKLDLPFRRRASLLGWVEGWGAGGGSGGRAAPPASRYICQHCLVHLGDLARYKQQLRVAHTFYRHALVLSAHSGQPYNQLALVWWRRGRRLGALYWHVRSLMVRAPFPPAPANLARTLAAAAAAAQGGRDLKDLPVLPGVTALTVGGVTSSAITATQRLDAHAYVSELIRAMHLIHTVDDLETAAAIVESLNSSLTALVATDSFEAMTLVKMAVVLIWLVHSSTDELRVQPSAQSPEEAQAAALAEALAASALLALLLPAYTADGPPQRALAALLVWLQWHRWHIGACANAWRARPQLWAALAHSANCLAPKAATLRNNHYETVPLPEEEELHGFLPLEEAHEGLRFADHAAWDAGGRLPTDMNENEPPHEVSGTCLSNEPELEHKVRALRIVQLAKEIAHLRPDHLSYTEEDNLVTLTASAVGGEQLSQALAELSLATAGAGAGGCGGVDDEGDSDDERSQPAPPIVISEADFREKVRDKRVGILKPQGSLERAREERALASTQDDQELEVSEELKEDKKEIRKPRVNIAMAAIMRKQEETNKQVKFVTPPPTPDSNANTDVKEDKPKVVQPKPMKSLANLPIGRKTGGILSLKDKSGYPHLVNTDPEPKKEDEKKKEPKPNQPSQNSQQSYQKRIEVPTSNWTNPMAPPAFDGPRANFQKPYAQSPGLSYSPGYQQNPGSQGIRLPVVNPKEIDVRTAALQKQNSRQELFQDQHKFGNHKYQVSPDKKNFLSDLPPRFANQYRYWQTPDSSENKFRDETFKANQPAYNQPPRSWNVPGQIEGSYPQSNPWWKPESQQQNFNYQPPINVQPNFYQPMNMNNPYQNMSSFNQMPNQSIGDKPPQQNLITPPNYMQSAIGQPQLQTLQSMVTSPNFSSSLNNFSYAQPVGYDAAMYPQFSNKLGYQPLQMKMMDKPSANMPLGYQNKDLMDSSLGFGATALDIQRMNFVDPLDGAKHMDQNGEASGMSASAGNTYSLFSGAPETPVWNSPQRAPQQSLWSGPGPSPLERLLEQQKQMKQPSAPQ